MQWPERGNIGTPRIVCIIEQKVFTGERKRGRYFSDEFKRDAVQLVIEKGVSVKKVARDLNIHPNLLHQWRRKYLNEGEHAFIGKGHPVIHASQNNHNNVNYRQKSIVRHTGC